MMKKVYSIRDNKMETFGTLVFIDNDSVATRMFGDLVTNAGDSLISKHPADFALYCLGEFDDVKGQMNNNPCPNLVAVGSDFLNPATEK